MKKEPQRMKKLTLTLLLFLFLSPVPISTQKPMKDWKSRTIYQVLTDRFYNPVTPTKDCQDLDKYCGGTYKGLIQNLDYIQGMGFDAIWITPIVKNIDQGYHGYWAKDINDVNENFGTKQDLKDLSTELKSRDMWLMVDIVANHMGPIPGGGFDFSILSPFNESKYYHKYCEISDWDKKHDQWRTENCRLYGLPDLDQNNTEVRTILKNWIKDIIQEYSIDGIRIDTVPFIDKQFWTEFNEAAGIYTLGEALDNRTDYVAGYQGPLDAMLNYPLYFTIIDVFANGASAFNLREKWNSINLLFKDTHGLGLFIDNHDRRRFLNYVDKGNLLRNALVTIFFSKGVPIMYYGTEQGFKGGDRPLDREALWPHMDTKSEFYSFVKQVVGLRKGNKVWEFEQVERYVDSSTYVFSRGDVVVLTSNFDQKDYTVKMSYLPYYEGQEVCDALGDMECFKMTNGIMEVSVKGGEPRVLLPKEKVFSDE